MPFAIEDRCLDNRRRLARWTPAPQSERNSARRLAHRAEVLPPFRESDRALVPGTTLARCAGLAQYIRAFLAGECREKAHSAR